MIQNGETIDDESFQKAVEARLSELESGIPAIPSRVDRYRKYLDEEHEIGRFSDKMYRESYTISRKLERYLVIRERAGLKPSEFTPVPERMASVRNAFILQTCIGCRGEDFFKLRMKNVAVSKRGIPYIRYSHSAVRKKEKIEYEYAIEVPLVRVAFDIVMRTRFAFHFGRRPDPYNRKIQEFLRFCGITREVCVYNNRTHQAEQVPICDAFTQLHIHPMHLDIVRESECLRGIGYTGARVMEKRKKENIEDQFWNLNWAFGQKSFRVDENLNIIEGVPFVERDVMIFQEQRDKLPGGRTNPYVLSSMEPMPAGEAKTQERVTIRNGCALLQPRKVVVCGGQFMEFMESLEEEHRRWIQYGIALLKILSDFQVTFVRDCGDTIYELQSAPRGFLYSVYFYLNGDTVVLMHGCLTEKHRRHKASGNGKMPVVRELRWKHVTGEISDENYDGVLDAVFGERDHQEGGLGNEGLLCLCEPGSPAGPD